MGHILNYSKWRKLYEEMVQLATVNLPNVDSDEDGTQKDFVNKGLVDDINAAAASIGIKAVITTAKTGHSTYTKDGTNISRHMDGTGVDVAILNGIGSGGATNRTNGNPIFRELGNKLKDALVSMGYVWNAERGNDKAVLWQTDIGGNHYNHLHISNRIGATPLPGKAAGELALDLGSSGEEVKKVQAKLGLPSTGIYDELTKEAVIAFQLNPSNKDSRGNSLVPDGKVGDKTREAMFKTTTTGATSTTSTDPEQVTVGSGKEPVILMGGLDYRENDKDLTAQAEILLTNLTKDKKIIAHRYNKLGEVLKSISANPGAKVVLFSAGASYAGMIAQVMKNKSDLYIVEPYGIDKATKDSVNSAVALGVPRQNVITGPSPARGIDVVSGATLTPADKNHWGALEYAGELIA